MPNRRMTAFFSVAMSIWTLMNVYVFWRLSTIPAIARLPRMAFVVIAVVLWSSYVLGRILSGRGWRTLAVPLKWVGAHWLGMIFLLLIALLAVDIITGFGHVLSPFANTLRFYSVGISLVLSLTALVQGFRAPVITSYEVGLRNLPAEQDGMVVAVATDMHVGETVGPDWLGRRIDQIQALRPDLIILGGDIVEGENYGTELRRNFARLSAPLGVFAVTGNHEYYSGVEASVRFLESAGVTMLRDRWVELRSGLLLAGIDDLTARRQFGNNGNFIEQSLQGRPDSVATIFVSHTPWHAETARAAGAGLMLSGHTHDGQIWPFRYLVQTQFPFISGRYDLGSMTLIVCRGSGTWGPRMRLWRRSEILRITLRRSDP